MNSESKTSAQRPPYNNTLKPSQYTCMLLREVTKYCSKSSCQNALDVGVGSGVMLAAVAQLGLNDIWGVDINPEAIHASASLLAYAAPTATPKLYVGDMWDPLPEDLRFSLVLANLPHFPGNHHDDSRPIGWDGGNGRELIDRFIIGLENHLASDGAAFITHHDLIGFQTTSDLIQRFGLSHETLVQWLVFESPERMQSVNQETLDAAHAEISLYGGYSFMNARILKIFR